MQVSYTVLLNKRIHSYLFLFLRKYGFHRIVRLL